LPLPLPAASSGTAPEDTAAPRVTINVLADGRVLLAGRAVSVEELTARLRQQVETDGRDLEVRIRSDRQAPYRQVEPIMLGCARAGIWNVTFAVYRPEDVR
jgi:biopolymer transport protein ExbD